MYKRMLLPLDGSPPSEHAAKVGLALAGRLKAELVLVHVVEPQRFQELSDYDEAVAQARTVGQSLLEHWQRQAKRHQVPATTHLEQHRDTAAVIFQCALRERCDLMVLGTHGRTGLPRLLLGSVAERVARLGPLPVLLVRGGNGSKLPRFKKPLVALDGSEYGQEALQHAAALARQLSAKLLLLHVVPDVTQMTVGSGRAWMYADKNTIMVQLHEEQARLREQGQFILGEAQKACPDLNVQTILGKAQHHLIGEVIGQTAKSEKADLIVMGTHGHTGWRQFFLGSVARDVAHLAEQPVLLVRKPSDEPEELHLPAPGE